MVFLNNQPGYHDYYYNHHFVYPYHEEEDLIMVIN